MIIQRFEDTYQGMYDFNVTGGAIGSYDLQVPIPINFSVLEFYFICSTDFSFGSGSSVSFDVILKDVNPYVTEIGGLLPATAVNTFAASVNMGISPIPLSLVPVGYNPNFITANSISIGMSISVAALTAGRIIVCIRGIGNDLQITS